MGPTMAEDDFDAEWRFVLALYARPDVAPACLRLQDELGVDVTVLLHVVWLHCAHGLAADPAALQALDLSVRAWRREVVEPLRRMRRSLKEAPHPVAPALLGATRQRVAEAELSAEQCAFTLLASVPWPDPAPRLEDARPVAAVALHYAEMHGREMLLGNCAAAIDTLQAAVKEAA